MATAISTDIVNETLSDNVRGLREQAAELNRQADEKLAEATALRAKAVGVTATADGLEGSILSPERIIVIVSDTFRIPVAVLLSKCRTQRVTFARQVACYVLHERFKFSAPKTGEKLSRDHSTVLHSCGVVAARLYDNSMVVKLVAKIEKTARGQGETRTTEEEHLAVVAA